MGEKMGSMTCESFFKLITVCDECSKLLNHMANPSGSYLEIRVERCPDCLKKLDEAKKMINLLLDCPDMNFDEIDEITIERIEEARKWLKQN